MKKTVYQSILHQITREEREKYVERKEENRERERERHITTNQEVKGIRRGSKQKRSLNSSKEPKNWLPEREREAREGNPQPYISQLNYARNVQLVHVPNGMYKTV